PWPPLMSNARLPMSAATSTPCTCITSGCPASPIHARTIIPSTVGGVSQSFSITASQLRPYGLFFASGAFFNATSSNDSQPLQFAHGLLQRIPEVPHPPRRLRPPLEVFQAEPLHNFGRRGHQPLQALGHVL